VQWVGEPRSFIRSWVSGGGQRMRLVQDTFHTLPPLPTLSHGPDPAFMATLIRGRGGGIVRNQIPPVLRPLSSVTTTNQKPSWTPAWPLIGPARVSGSLLFVGHFGEWVTWGPKKRLPEQKF
jgi:hypothetical protein